MRFTIRALAVVGMLAGSLTAAPRATAQATPAQQAPAFFPADLPGAGYTPPMQNPPPPAPYTLPPAEPIRIPEQINNDPLLDRPFSPPPGFYLYKEVFITSVHLSNQLSGTVTTPGGRTDGVAPPGSPLDMSVSPRFELGYRMPNGFGEVGLGFRWLTTSGGGTNVGAFGPAAQHGRFNFNVIDLNYHSREFSLGWFPGDQWDFRWTAGFRALNLYFDDHLNFLNPGTGPEAVASQSDTNSLNAYGAHFGFDLHRKLDCWVPGLAFGGRVDFTDLFGRVRQHYFETFVGGAGAAAGYGRFETAPLALEVQLGLSYTVPNWNHAFFFVGYDTQYWWQIGRLSNFGGTLPNAGSAVDSRATLELQGFVIRAEINF